MADYGKIAGVKVEDILDPLGIIRGGVREINRAASELTRAGNSMFRVR